MDEDWASVCHTILGRGCAQGGDVNIHRPFAVCMNHDLTVISKSEINSLKRLIRCDCGIACVILAVLFGGRVIGAVTKRGEALGRAINRQLVTADAETV